MTSRPGRAASTAGRSAWSRRRTRRFRARFSVAIRTAVVDRAAGTAVYGAGGGITWDSDPAAEWAELLAKAAVLGRRPVQSGRWNTRKSHGVARRGSRAG